MVMVSIKLWCRDSKLKNEKVKKSFKRWNQKSNWNRNIKHKTKNKKRKTMNKKKKKKIKKKNKKKKKK